MGHPRPPSTVKLFAGLLGGDPDVLRRARQLLARRWGPVELESDIWPFDQTDYYADEMGPHLQRWFVGFGPLVRPDELAGIKLETNALEAQLGEDCLQPDIPRPVNIDPGYVDLTKLVLATTKDRGHRIYMGHGIYAEVTLQYARSAWQVLPWTYPDYMRSEYHEFFTRLRARLHEQHRDADRTPADDAPITP